ncbi:unnamed protein product [Urochloa humidicola]
MCAATYPDAARCRAARLRPEPTTPTPQRGTEACRCPTDLFIDLAVLEAATDGFSDDNLLGRV